MRRLARRVVTAVCCAPARPGCARAVAASIAALTVAALAAPVSALAAGGTSIASAPVISAGVTESANTSTDAVVQGATSGPQAVGCWIELEYWRLPLSAGDRVQLSGHAIAPMTNLELGVFPPGTTDATIATAQPTTTGFPTAGRSIDFTATASGTYVLVGGPNCYNSDGGPFTFDVAVTPPAAAQTVAVSLAPHSQIPLRGSLAATVDSSEGAPITDGGLTLKLYGSWRVGAGAAGSHLLGTSTAAHGAAHFAYQLPAALRGTRVTLRIVGSAAPGYRASASSSLTVTVG